MEGDRRRDVEKEETTHSVTGNLEIAIDGREGVLHTPSMCLTVYLRAVALLPSQGKKGATFPRQHPLLDSKI